MTVPAKMLSYLNVNFIKAKDLFITLDRFVNYVHLSRELLFWNKWYTVRSIASAPTVSDVEDVYIVVHLVNVINEKVVFVT